MAIVGEVFAQGVKTQIQQREKMLGAGGEASPLGVRSPDYIKVQNKTSWLRLASAVDIKVDETNTPSGRLNEYKERVEKIKQQFGVQGDSELAKKLVLTSGTQQYSGDTLTAKAEINTSGTLINDGAYGFGGSAFGYKPMPGLISATFDYLNNGALAKAEVKLKCSSVDQLELLEALYLRPGYTVLLEWGHTTYLDNSGVVQTYDGLTKAFQKFFNPGQSEGDTTNVAKIADLIRQEREYRDYNYDGFVGVVTNFNWSFNTDGSYDVTLKIITHGSVIESLKVNSVVNSTETKEDTSTAVQKKVQQSGIGRKLKALMDAFGQSDSSGLQARGLENIYEDPVNRPTARQGVSINQPSEISSFYNFLTAKYVDSITGYEADTVKEVAEVKLNFELEEDTKYAQYYITLGRLLGMLEKNNLYYTNDGNPYIGIEYRYYQEQGDVKKYVTPMLSFPGQYSADPLVCSIPVVYLPNPASSDPSSITFDLQIEKSTILVADNVFNLDPADVFSRNLMAIHVNFKAIFDSLEDNINTEGRVNLINFLKSLLGKIAQALGGINKFGTRFDEDTKKLEIYDESTHITGRLNNLAEHITRINPYGVTGNRGSFVQNLNFQSELTNEFSTQIAVGAQANGNEIGENATAFSEFNIGLIDRISPIKTRELISNTPTLFSRFKKSLLIAQQILVKLYDGDKSKVTADNIETLKSINSDYAQYILGYFTHEKKIIPAPFFIPFNLNLGVEGISGIKLFQRFNLVDRILPYMYRGKVDFIIKGLKHEIVNNKWTTKIETLTAPTGQDFNILTLPAILTQLKATELIDASLAEGDLRTITTGYPIKQFFFDRVTPKTQIYLHHTAGGPSVPAVLNDWSSKAADKISTHYVISPFETEQVFSDDYWAWHLGIPEETFLALKIPYRNLNATSLSIELTSYGALRKQGAQYYSSAKEGFINPDEVGEPVSADLKPLPNGYRGFKYYQKYTPQQIQQCKGVLQAWIQKYGIKFIFNYNDLFPNTKTSSLSKNALKGVSGIYTHNSVRTDKTDVWPQYELIQMLQELSRTQQDEQLTDNIVTRLHVLISGRTTSDEQKAIVDLLSPLDKAEYNLVSAKYQARYKTSLEGELVSELSVNERASLNQAFRRNGFTVPALAFYSDRNTY